MTSLTSRASGLDSLSESDRNLVNILNTFGEVDQDLLGLGAMIGFLSAGALTQLASILLHRLKDCKSHTLGPKCEITKTHFTYRTARALVTPAVEDPLQFWINLISAFLVGLSDQQLVMGLAVVAIIVATKGASSSMVMAQYIAFFTLITHAATVATMRPYFRRFRLLTSIRMAIMLAAFAVFIIVNVSILQIITDIIGFLIRLQASSTETSEMKSLKDELATIFAIEVSVMSWVYLSMVPSLYLSDELINVRKAVGRWPMRKEEVDTSAISAWLEKRDEGRASIFSKVLLAPHAFFCRAFLRTRSKPIRTVFWFIAELVFPWMLVPLALFILFIGLVVALCLSAQVTAARTEWNYGQIITLVMVALPFWSLICSYVQDTTDAKDEKKEMMGGVGTVNLKVDGKTWNSSQNSSDNPFGTGDNISSEPQYRPRSRQYDEQD